MSPYLLIPLLALLALAQTTLMSMLPTGPAKPDLVLVLVVGWGIVRGGGEATLWALGGGLFLDLVSGVPFGLQTVGLAAVGLLADLMETNFFRSNILIPLSAIFIATLLFHIIEAAMMQTTGYPIDWGTFLLRIVLPTAGLNTALMPLVYFLLRRLDRVEHPRLNW